jgi:hypothetical protein
MAPKNTSIDVRVLGRGDAACLRDCLCAIVRAWGCLIVCVRLCAFVCARGAHGHAGAQDIVMSLPGVPPSGVLASHKVVFRAARELYARARDCFDVVLTLHAGYARVHVNVARLSSPRAWWRVTSARAPQAPRAAPCPGACVPRPPRGLQDRAARLRARVHGGPRRRRQRGGRPRAGRRRPCVTRGARRRRRRRAREGGSAARECTYI